MAQISVEELYRSEGGGTKYGAGGIMGAVIKDFLLHGVPKDYDDCNFLAIQGFWAIFAPKSEGCSFS